MSPKSFVVRGYGRCSTEEQCQSPKQQEDVCLEAFNLFKKVKPDWVHAQWGGWFFDEGVTRTSKFTLREVGSLVLAATRPGDCIIAAKYDRLFANVIDVCEVIELIEQKQFRICALDMDIDISHHLGQGLFKILAVIKEMEVKEIRQRARDSSAYRRKFGLPNNRCAPIGWRNADNETGDGRIFVPDEAQRNLAKKLLSFRNRPENRFSSMVQFSTAVNRQGFRHPSGRPWGRKTLAKWLDAVRNGFPKVGHSPDVDEDDSGSEAIALAAVGGNHLLS